MPLPVKEAADLASHMAKSGLSGSIMMSKKAPMLGKEDDEAMPEDNKSDYDTELDACVSDLADAIQGGEKDQLVMALHNLVDCLKHEDQEQDQSDMES